MLWQGAIIHRLGQESRQVTLDDDEVRRQLALAMELIHGLCDEAASTWLAGRSTRADAEAVVAVLVDHVPQRFIDRAQAAAADLATSPSSNRS